MAGRVKHVVMMDDALGADKIMEETYGEESILGGRT